MHKVGDKFMADYAKPDKLCDKAWKAMYQYVFAISHGSGIFYTMVTGLISRDLPFVAVMMAFVLLFSKLPLQIKNPYRPKNKSIIYQTSYN